MTVSNEMTAANTYYGSKGCIAGSRLDYQGIIVTRRIELLAINSHKPRSSPLCNYVIKSKLIAMLN